MKKTKRFSQKKSHAEYALSRIGSLQQPVRIGC